MAEGLGKDKGSLWADGDQDRTSEVLPDGPAPTAEEEAPQDRGTLPPPPKADRFRFVLGALAGLGVAAIVAAAALITSSGSGDDDGQWSPWKPTAEGDQGATQIASFVGSTYRDPEGQQLVAVKASPLKIEQLPLSVARRGAKGQIEVDEGQGVRYTMCGLGPNCSIAGGKPSVARGVLLQREALELALYTFRYLPSIDQVVTFLPPRPGEKAQQAKAVYVQRDTVERALNQPLAATLSSPTPSTKTLRAGDISAVNQFAGKGVHCFSFRVGQDVSAFLVLDPPVAKCRGGIG